MKSTKILVIDDERAICDGCKLVLADEGYAVDTCQWGRKGLDILLGGGYDVTLLDMKLPDMDGLEIIQTLRRERPGVYIIVMTGYSSVENAVEAMKSGAFDYLSKPFADDELLIAVEKAVENKRLKDENRYLRQQLVDRGEFRDIIGENPHILKLFEDLKKVAPTDSTVLICGETGTGKELFAKAIHAHSKRADRAFIAVDCSTFAPSLLESELFGHVKGAFTGAVKDKAGVFEAADGGTFFLDEVANLDLSIQGKLLRAMETQEFKPVGGSHTKLSDVRIISATNRDLKTMVDQGTFREDLFYRLNIFPLFIPPLRERRDDIPRLLYHFLSVYCRATGKRIDGFSDDALEMLTSYDWPGNVRQLRNTVERLVILADERILDNRSLTDNWETKGPSVRDGIPETLEELRSVKKDLLENRFGQIERAFLQQALLAEKGNITQAAGRVGMQRSNFSALMKKHHLSTVPPKSASTEDPSGK
ncbi:MAG: sigma-54 dependent transcriptional regulator [Deltaproteobacteria bacterium]|nr:sigma-54 dependent transcriptional regulator [Deltaproteobacteria bacterium]